MKIQGPASCSSKKYFLANIQKTEEGADIADFNFARYISCCMDDIVADLIHFSEVTWIVIWIIFALHGVLVAIFDYSSDGIELQLTLLATFVPPFGGMIISWVIHCDLKGVEDRARQDDLEAMKTCWPAALSAQLVVSRVLQGLTFITAYSVARDLASKTYWDSVKDDGHEVWEIIYNTLIYVSICFYTVPNAVAACAVIFSMPPHLDKADWNHIRACQIHHQRLVFLSQSGDQPSASEAGEKLEVETNGAPHSQV